jgi:hypothetical protein
MPGQNLSPPNLPISSLRTPLAQPKSKISENRAGDNERLAVVITSRAWRLRAGLSEPAHDCPSGLPGVDQEASTRMMP